MEDLYGKIPWPQIKPLEDHGRNEQQHMIIAKERKWKKPEPDIGDWWNLMALKISWLSWGLIFSPLALGVSTSKICNSLGLSWRWNRYTYRDNKGHSSISQTLALGRFRLMMMLPPILESFSFRVTWTRRSLESLQRKSWLFAFPSALSSLAAPCSWWLCGQTNDRWNNVAYITGKLPFAVFILFGVFTVVHD